MNRIDTAAEKQFSAVTVKLGDRSAYIAFRGTDDTIVGWKEDLNLAFMDIIPSQSDACEYVERAARAMRFTALRLGGHSKGGNLAVYAALHVPQRVASRILGVYNNDGPGFLRSVADSEAYVKLKDRIHTFVPQCSIVGMLLEHDQAYQVVESTQNGVFQHDGFSWQVRGTSFVKREALAEESMRLSRAIHDQLAALEPEQRKELVNAVYEWLSATNAQTLTELNEDRGALLKALKGLNGKSKELVLRAIKFFVAEGIRHVSSGSYNESKRKKGI